MRVYLYTHILYLHFLFLMDTSEAFGMVHKPCCSGFWGKRNRSRQLKNEAIGEGSCAGKAKVA